MHCVGVSPSLGAPLKLGPLSSHLICLLVNMPCLCISILWLFDQCVMRAYCKYLYCRNVHPHHHWQNSKFWAIGFPRSSARLHLVFTSLDFASMIMFSQSKICQPFIQPPAWRTWSLYLYPPGTGGPVIPPGTGFPFCYLLELAGLQWRYSDPPTHRES
jgi:hypothetical protein